MSLRMLRVRIRPDDVLIGDPNGVVAVEAGREEEREEGREEGWDEG
jgi:regulator of RNase E activity RraA